jgi:hypothetical protein
MALNEVKTDDVVFFSLRHPMYSRRDVAEALGTSLDFVNFSLTEWIEGRHKY